jgi:hypothetical protein
VLALTLQSHGAFGAIRTRGLLLTEETLYPLELRRRELGAQGSNLEKTQGQGLPGLPIPHHSSRALGRNRTGFLPVTSRPLCQVSYVQGRGVPGAIRTRTTDLLGIVTPAIGLRGHGASGRSRTACLPRTKRTLFPGELQRRELGNQGSNLDSLASEASVLPGYTIPH